MQHHSAHGRNTCRYIHRPQERPSPESAAASSALLAGCCDEAELQALFGLQFDVPLEWPARPLLAALRRLEALVATALSGPHAAISPSIQPVATYDLRPVPYEALERLKASLAAEPLSSSGGTGGGEPGVAEATACFAAEDAESGDGFTSVGVFRLRAPSTSGSSSGGGGVVGIEAQGLVLRLPEGSAAVDFASYKDQQVALLADVAGDNAQIMLCSHADCAFVDLGDGSANEGSASSGGSVAERCAQQGAVEALGDTGSGVPLRVRSLPYARGQAPLTVSGSRGVAAVFSSLARACVLDLQEDEEGGDEEGGGEGEDEDME